MNTNPGLPQFEAWRIRARDFLRKGAVPSAALWDDNPRLFEDDWPHVKPTPFPVVPAEFLELAKLVIRARDPDRDELLYRLLFRLNYENRNLLRIPVDPDVSRVNDLAKSVSRDIHKMHAFVRFKRTEINGIETYVAWHRSEHLCLELAAPFFVRRFGDKPWSIFTPDASAHWNLRELSFAKGLEQTCFEHDDPFDEVWKTYYGSIYNPARLKIKAMHAEMPVKYWENLPEASLIRDLIRQTPARLQDMAANPRYRAEPPANASWEELRAAARACQSCPLAEHATQTVFGEGDPEADLMIVGEQPGDEEDRAGKVFVGPAGRMLGDLLREAGLDRDSVYVTNAVKHFKWTPHEKVRLHKKASGAEMQACKPWLEAEIARVKPKVILALGITAGTALYGRLVKIQEERGQVKTGGVFAPALCISWHPAAILRSATGAEASRRRQELLDDLKKAADLTRAFPPKRG